MKKIALPVLLSLVLSSCALFNKKVDPNIIYTTKTGFQFQVPSVGQWYAGPVTENQYMFGQNPQEDETTKILVAHHGPVSMGGMTMTNKQILDSFQNIIVRESKGGRAKNVKNEFSQRKFKNADCLFFSQNGQDRPGSVVMDMSNDGMICLHPTKKEYYIWLAISERRPVGKPSSVDADKTQFFESLKFLD